MNTFRTKINKRSSDGVLTSVYFLLFRNAPPKEIVGKSSPDVELEVQSEKKPTSGSRVSKRGSSMRPESESSGRKGQKKKPGSRMGTSPQQSTLSTMHEDPPEQKEEEAAK